MASHFGRVFKRALCNLTVGQNIGSLDGSNRLRGLFAPYPVSTEPKPDAAAEKGGAAEPDAEILGCGLASIANTEQKGNTSMNSIRLRRPLGWKKDTAVEGRPKAMK
jgi:hypothetical protein